MKIKDFKIRIRDESHSREVQEFLFKHGCTWVGGENYSKNCSELYLYIENTLLKYGTFQTTFTEHPSPELTLEELKSLYPLEEEFSPYEHKPFPTDESYVVLKWVKDFDPSLKKITCQGDLPKIKKGTVTWVYLENWIGISTICPEDNRWFANIPREWFEVVEEVDPTKKTETIMTPEKSSESTATKEFSVGDEVQIRNGSKYYHQGFSSGVKMKGVIVEDLNDLGWYRVEWSNGNINTYQQEDLEPYQPLKEEPEMTPEQILQKAKDLFPIGTEYICARNKEKKFFAFREPRIIERSNGKNVDVGGGYVCYEGVWATPLGISQDYLRAQTYLGKKFRCPSTGEVYEQTSNIRQFEDGDIDCGRGYIRHDGRWAEIVEIVKDKCSTTNEPVKSIDMKAIQEECKRRFPIGSTFKNFSGKIFTLKQDDTVYKIDGDKIYAHSGAGCFYYDGQWAELISLPDGSNPINSQQKEEKKTEKSAEFVKVIDVQPITTSVYKKKKRTIF